jgi:hypothetical protein
MEQAASMVKPITASSSTAIASRATPQSATTFTVIIWLRQRHDAAIRNGPVWVAHT